MFTSNTLCSIKIYVYLQHPVLYKKICLPAKPCALGCDCSPPLRPDPQDWAPQPGGTWCWCCPRRWFPHVSKDKKYFNVDLFFSQAAPRIREGWDTSGWPRYLWKVFKIIFSPGNKFLILLSSRAAQDGDGDDCGIICQVSFSLWDFTLIME